MKIALVALCACLALLAIVPLAAADDDDLVAPNVCTVCAFDLTPPPE